MGKEFWKSKLFWFGSLWVVIGVANLFGFADFVPGEQLGEIASIINGVIIILLRYLTKEPMEFRL